MCRTASVQYCVSCFYLRRNPLIEDICYHRMCKFWQNLFQTSKMTLLKIVNHFLNTTYIFPGKWKHSFLKYQRSFKKGFVFMKNAVVKTAFVRTQKTLLFYEAIKEITFSQIVGLQKISCLSVTIFQPLYQGRIQDFKNVSQNF